MNKQKGIALITILVMVALATILAATIGQRQKFTADNTAYLIRQNQSLWYAKSAETFFAEMLKEDAENASDVDYLQENWAKPMPAFPVEDGYVTGQLYDESGKFNLNSLIDDSGQVNVAAKQWFERLLMNVGLTAELSEAVIDWQDADNENIGPMGAEENYYRGLNNAYLPANTKFHSVDELKMVRGFEGEKYLKIAPYVSTISVKDTKLNINTAPAIVLASLDEHLDVKAVQAALETRQQNIEHFANLDEFWKLAPFSQINADTRSSVQSLLGVKSNYFRAKIEVVLSERKRQFQTNLLREDKKVYVLSRSLAPE
ncbi:type II secretion system minor pseudopilin GspK [Acinetobacter sp. ANC 4173]|uniref:type II secretion system minor pseudopilin GspK n=1 Tax=Acinetobacter sp. ANC 4173 TaxID=2529837 RepID=UPI00103C0417|nr:type II secretion system minor pseudopilin GspK [Acinetobacter sp. ANC 4173]TCB77511.1 general secretion pathway protein GspK [Acinetobacter sp. ANC 4173]